MKNCVRIVCLLVALAAPGAFAQQQPVSVSFDDMDYNGWTILGYQDFVWQAQGGNPGAHLNFFLDNFYIRVYNRTSADFIGDYGAKGPVLLTGDLRWRTINFFGTDVTRDLFFAIWDEYLDGQGNLRTHVLLRPLGKIRGQGPAAPFRTSRIRITDPDATGLPGGWLYWDFDGAHEPTRTLPPGVTWQSILSSVDRVQWTTATPGLFFGFTFFDVSFDNATIGPLAGGGRAESAGVETAARFGLDVAGGPDSGNQDLETPDGTVDKQDLDKYRAWFYAGSMLADVTTTGSLEGDWSYGLSDGVLDEDDLLAYQDAWMRVAQNDPQPRSRGFERPRGGDGATQLERKLE